MVDIWLKQTELLAPQLGVFTTTWPSTDIFVNALLRFWQEYNANWFITILMAPNNPGFQNAFTIDDVATNLHVCAYTADGRTARM